MLAQAELSVSGGPAVYLETALRDSIVAFHVEDAATTLPQGCKANRKQWHGFLQAVRDSFFVGYAVMLL